MDSKARQIVNKMKELDIIKDEIRNLELAKAVEEEKKLFKKLNYHQQNEDEKHSIENFCNLLNDFKYKLNLLKLFLCKDKSNKAKDQYQVKFLLKKDYHQMFQELFTTILNLNEYQLSSFEGSLEDLKYVRETISKANDLWKSNISSIAQLSAFLAKVDHF